MWTEKPADHAKANSWLTSKWEHVTTFQQQIFYLQQEQVKSK